MEHLTDDELERYYLGMIADDSPEQIRIEEHLLWCHDCQDRSIESREYVDVIRAALVRRSAYRS